MNRIIAVCAALVLSGCANMTPGQKTAALVIGSVAITAAIISASDDGKASACKPTVSGSGADFDFGCR